MAIENVPLQVFNRGRISKLGLGRTDLDRTRLSAEIQCNWMPRTLGSMMIRPGFDYIGDIRNYSSGILIPFVYSKEDTAVYEMTSTAMRVWVSDQLVQRVASTAAVTLGDFSSTLLGGWTDNDESGSTSEWVAGNYLSLTGTRYAFAGRFQEITSTAGTHTINMNIARGRVNFKVGSSSGHGDYFPEKTLRPGYYSFAVDTTGDFTIHFSANTEYRSLVESVSVQTSSGPMVLDTPWSGTDLRNLRWDQSGDVIFTDCKDIQPRRIERYGVGQYGIAIYDPLDGPFRSINETNTRLTASSISGNITLTADQPLFLSGHSGALFRMTSIGQKVTVTPAGTDQWSDPIRVSGIEGGRIFDIDIVSSTGFDATVRVQKSVGETGNWVDETGLVWTTTQDTTHDDGQDNQIIFYRIGVGSTYTSGSPVCTLTYGSGGINGVVRVDSVIDSLTSSASVLTNLGSTQATELWQEGEWSTYRGWPTANVIHEGRMFHGGKGKLIGSIPDDYESFDEEVEGDSAVINRSLGSGAIDNVRWLVSLGSLIVGTDSREIQIKTSSLEEALTATNFNPRDISTQGSANVQAVRIDKRLLFVQSAGQRVMEVGYSGDSLNYETADRSILVPEIGEPELLRLSVQRQPDTRIHGIRKSTGTAALLLSDPAENVTAWLDIKTGPTLAGNSFIEDSCVVPSTGEDAVYYMIQRIVDGSTRRYLEKWAQESEARGGRRLPWTSYVFPPTSTGGDSTGLSAITIESTAFTVLPDGSVGSAGLGSTGSTNTWGQAVSFDSTDTFLHVNEVLNTATVANEGCMSFWLKLDSAADGALNTLFIHGTEIRESTAAFNPLQQIVHKLNTDKFRVNLEQESTGVGGVSGALFESFPGSVTSTMGWMHVFLEWKQDSSFGKIWINETDQTDTTGGLNSFSLTPTGIDWTGRYSPVDHIFIGCGMNFIDDGTTNYAVEPSGAAASLNGCMAEFWLDIDSRIDFSIEANRRKFVTSTGGPAFLGGNGTSPNSVLPDIYLKGGSTNWGTNYGAAQDIPQNSTFTNCADSPSTVGLEASTPASTETGPFASGVAPQYITITGNPGDEGSTVAATFVGVEKQFSQNLKGGGTVPGSNGANKIFDSNIAQHTSNSTDLVTGIDHLVGETVHVWGDNRDLGTYTVSSTGTITISRASTSTFVGLAYDAWWKSAKLAYASQAGTGLTQKKRVKHVGLILADTHAKGIEYGQSTGRLSPLPITQAGKPTSSDAVFEEFDETSFPLKAEWDTDSRLVLKASSPRPCTVLAAIITVDEKDKL